MIILQRALFFSLKCWVTSFILVVLFAICSSWCYATENANANSRQCRPVRSIFRDNIINWEKWISRQTNQLRFVVCAQIRSARALNWHSNVCFSVNGRQITCKVHIWTFQRRRWDVLSEAIARQAKEKVFNCFSAIMFLSQVVVWGVARAPFHLVLSFR